MADIASGENVKISKRWDKFLTAGVISVIVTGLLAGLAHVGDKPNIILILSDDFGYGDAGVYAGGPDAVCRRPASTAWPTRE
jgi:hypothetical protein